MTRVRSPLKIPPIPSQYAGWQVQINDLEPVRSSSNDHAKLSILHANSPPEMLVPLGIMEAQLRASATPEHQRNMSPIGLRGPLIGKLSYREAVSSLSAAHREIFSKSY